MKKIIAINASPRKNWNTDLLVRKAAEGAAEAGAEIEVIDLYRLPKFTGCISCFGCKRPVTLATCVCRDGLYEVLEKIRSADGIIIGSPVYLGDLTAGFRALFERMLFPYITYRTEVRNYNTRQIPIVLIITSNTSAVKDEPLAEKYSRIFEHLIGPARTLISGNTLQVSNYEDFNWSSFNPEEKKKRREEVFPSELEEAFRLGKQMISE